MEREYRVSAIEDIETTLALLRKIYWAKELVGLNGSQVSRLRSSIIDLSKVETELGEEL